MDRATTQGGIMVSAQTMYPSVSGKPARATVSISAPQRPHAPAVTLAQTSQLFLMAASSEDQARQAAA
jgi:hypothetical protein